MAYLIVFIFLMVAELIYFRIADRFNIIDKPNERSSHKTIVLRGGGIIFTISLLVFFFTHQLAYPWFMLGVVTIAGISFADDVKPLPSWLRFMLHAICAGLILFQFIVLNLYKIDFEIIVFIFFISGIINAYNFMDGINGITTGYSFTILAALLFLNHQLKIFNQDAIIYLALGNLVFFIFNFRTKAKCFAGDVGSIAMAFALLFFTVGFILKTSNLIFILLFSVYGIDAGLTILYRLIKKENIFKAHRQHLYQRLANDKNWTQLSVSTIYMLVQAIINLCICIFWQANHVLQLVFTVIVLGGLALVYILAKRSVLKAK